MGACFVTCAFDGKLTKKELTEHYFATVDELRNAYGDNAYNGTFSTLSGFEVTDYVFTTKAAAGEYLADICTKGESAIAVKYTDTRKEYTKEPTFNGKKLKQWDGGAYFRVVDATDWSYTMRCLVSTVAPAVADQLTPEQKKTLATAYDTWRVKKKTADRVAENFDATLSGIARTKELITPETLEPLLRFGNQRHELRLDADAAAMTLRALDEQFTAELYTEQTIDLGSMWLVGGLCRE